MRESSFALLLQPSAYQQLRTQNCAATLVAFAAETPSREPPEKAAQRMTSKVVAAPSAVGMQSNPWTPVPHEERTRDLGDDMYGVGPRVNGWSRAEVSSRQDPRRLPPSCRILLLVDEGPLGSTSDRHDPAGHPTHGSEPDLGSPPKPLRLRSGTQPTELYRRTHPVEGAGEVPYTTDTSHDAKAELQADAVTDGCAILLHRFGRARDCAQRNATNRSRN